MTTTAALLDALRWRYATKQFDPTRVISEETWAALEEALVLTPSSFGLQPWRFLVVRDVLVREKLIAESWGQTQIADASHLVVFTARTDLTDADIDAWISRMAEVQDRTPESLVPYRRVVSGYAGTLTPAQRAAWNDRQIYIALGQLITAAALLGIDTCPMEGINPAGYDEILGLIGSGYGTRVALPLGYRLDSDKYAAVPKARFPRENVIRHI